MTVTTAAVRMNCSLHEFHYIQYHLAQADRNVNTRMVTQLLKTWQWFKRGVVSFHPPTFKHSERKLPHCWIFFFLFSVNHNCVPTQKEYSPFQASADVGIFVLCSMKTISLEANPGPFFLFCLINLVLAIFNVLQLSVALKTPSDESHIFVHMVFLCNITRIFCVPNHFSCRHFLYFFNTKWHLLPASLLF